MTAEEKPETDPDLSEKLLKPQSLQHQQAEWTGCVGAGGGGGRKRREEGEEGGQLEELTPPPSS